MPDSRQLSSDMPPPSPDEETKQLVEGILRSFEEARKLRYNFEMQWNEAALLCWPEWANTFFYGYERMPGQKLSLQQIDSTLSIASHRFGAICDTLMTPFNENWSVIKGDPYLMKQRGVKEYYERYSDGLWRMRYAACAGFIGQNTVNWQSLGVFGNMNMFIDELDGGPFGNERGSRYMSVPIGQMWYRENHQGVIDSYFRAFKWDARRIKQRWPDTFPPELVPNLESNSSSPHWIIQHVCPRDDWQPWMLTSKGKRWASYYISVTGRRLLEEGGYRKFPMAIGRYMQAPDEVFGRGPAQIILATGKTLNAEKATFLKQGHRAGDPVFLTADDGMMSADFYPGATIGGGLTSDGKPRVGILPTGNISITKEMMDVEREIVNDAFLLTLFQFALKLDQTPQMSARQVVEYLEQKGALLGPTVGRQLSEYCASTVRREMDLFDMSGMAPPMHPAVREAMRAGNTGYVMEWSNPLTRAMEAGKTAALMQSVEMTAEIANSSQDQSVWDVYDFPTAIPEAGQNRGVPVHWFATPEKQAAKAKARQQAEQADQQIKAMPAQAAIEKAHAITAKAQTGGNIGGALSGVPGSQMPLVPGNPKGSVGRPGVGGRPGLPGRPG